MNREYSQKYPNCRHGEAEKQKTAADDLRFMRSVIEKTCRQIDPGWPIMIVWGQIFMIGYIVSHFFVIYQLRDWLWPIYLLLLAIAFGAALYFGAQANMRERKAGLISQLTKQIYWIWFILAANGTIWTCLGLFRDYVGGFGFLWAAIYGIALSMMGILYSKEWLYGGIAIFCAILAAFYITSYAYVILGIVTGLACTMPAIIAQRNFRTQEKENEQALPAEI